MIDVFNHMITLILNDKINIQTKVYQEDKKSIFHKDAIMNIKVQLDKQNIYTPINSNLKIEANCFLLANDGNTIIANMTRDNYEEYFIWLPSKMTESQKMYLRTINPQIKNGHQIIFKNNIIIQEDSLAKVLIK